MQNVAPSIPNECQGPGHRHRRPPKRAHVPLGGDKGRGARQERGARVARGARLENLQIGLVLRRRARLQQRNDMAWANLWELTLEDSYGDPTGSLVTVSLPVIHPDASLKHCVSHLLWLCSALIV